jgi:dihydrofolate synthase/folylpolyglutamate synthase
LGVHQLVNAVSSYASLNLNLNWEISSENIKKGFSILDWPGRFKKIQKEPLIVPNGVYNFSSAIALKETLEDYVRFERLFLICGMMKDKDSYSFLNTLEPLVNSFHFLPLPRPKTKNLRNCEKVSKIKENPYIFTRIFNLLLKMCIEKSHPKI